MAMVKWKDRALRAANTLATVRESIEGAIPNARHDGEVVVGGALAGGIRGAFEASGKEYAIPAPGGIKLPPEIVIGTALEALAFAKPKSDASRDIHAVASGILAYSAGRELENWMRTRQAAK